MLFSVVENNRKETHEYKTGYKVSEDVSNTYWYIFTLVYIAVLFTELGNNCYKIFQQKLFCCLSKCLLYFWKKNPKTKKKHLNFHPWLSDVRTDMRHDVRLYFFLHFNLSWFLPCLQSQSTTWKPKWLLDSHHVVSCRRKSTLAWSMTDID